MKRALTLVTTLALVLPQVAMAAEANGEEKFDPSHEFEQHPWVPIHIGPIDLSITKAVAYLILGSLLTMALGVFLMRVKLSLTPGPRQTLGEWIYDIAQQNIAEQGLPHKAISRWFPYVASLFLFILVVNLIGFIPLPLSDETFELFGVELPTLGIYAAKESDGFGAPAPPQVVGDLVQRLQASGQVRQHRECANRRTSHLYLIR